MLPLHLHPDMVLDLHNQHLDELRAEARRVALVRGGRGRRARRPIRVRLASWRHATAP